MESGCFGKEFGRETMKRAEACNGENFELFDDFRNCRYPDPCNISRDVYNVKQWGGVLNRLSHVVP